MKTNQTLKENYEYFVPKEDVDSIKKAATAGFKKIMIILGAAALAITVALIICHNRTAACAALTAGIMLLLFWWSALRSTNRGFDKTKESAPDDLLYKIRIYDDFLVCERSNDYGISLLSTASLYDVAILGENDK